MPSFQDSAVLILLALLLFGPKGLAKLARQLGKLMGEFRRASNEFRMQMEDEFRLEEQAEQQKKIEAMQAAAPVAPAFAAEPAPHTPPQAPLQTDYTYPEMTSAEPAAEVLPIATSGDLHLMPPATGLPEPRSRAASLSDVFESIPHTPAEHVPEHESALNG
jgi:sec-independent protein translocase protein TatB